MFFVTILLNEVLAWVRRQPGTSSLRAILYMDEVFGFFPPTANPPCKTPMLTLLKQARAFGVGIVLATQNPVDLDYKGLSNCGTWFLGRLQTERDKARVLDGLEGATASAGAQFNRSETDRILSGLGTRVFLMNNVHDDAPVVMQSRWALCYLRGPLTRDQIATLMAPRKSIAPSPAASATPQPVGEESSHPMLPPDVKEIFLPRRTALLGDDHQLYRPGLYGAARVHFENKTAGVDESRDVWFVIASVEKVSATMWDDAADADEPPEQQPQPDDGAKFAPLPSALAKPKTYAELSTALKRPSLSHSAARALQVQGAQRKLPHGRKRRRLPRPHHPADEGAARFVGGETPREIRSQAGVVAGANPQSRTAPRKGEAAGLDTNRQHGNPVRHVDSERHVRPQAGLGVEPRQGRHVGPFRGPRGGRTAGRGPRGRRTSNRCKSVWRI